MPHHSTSYHIIPHYATSYYSSLNPAPAGRWTATHPPPDLPPRPAACCATSCHIAPHYTTSHHIISQQPETCLLQEGGQPPTRLLTHPHRLQLAVPHPATTRCHIKPHDATLYHKMPHYTTSRHIIPHHTTLYPIMPYYTTSCHSIPHHAKYPIMPHYTPSCHIPHHATLYHIMPHYTTSCHIIPHHATLSSALPSAGRWTATHPPPHPLPPLAACCATPYHIVPHQATLYHITPNHTTGGRAEALTLTLIEIPTVPQFDVLVSIINVQYNSDGNVV